MYRARGLEYAKDVLVEFSREEELFRESVREFCERVVRPRWVEVDENPRIETLADVYSRMGGQGLFAIPCSSRFGGQDGTITLAAIAVEEVAYADPAISMAVFTLLNNGWPFILDLLGGEEARAEVIPEVAKGRAFFGIASTEPQGGSDIAGIRTRAERRGGAYVVTGEKVYVSGVREVEGLPWGGGWVLVARTGGEGHRGLSTLALIARRGGGGLVKGFKPMVLETIGKHGLSTGGFKLDGVEVGLEYLVGEENKGFYNVMQGFNVARVLVAAACIGASRWLLEEAASWVKERRLFGGRPVSSFQGVSFRFSELYAKFEAARYFTYRAARLADKIYISRDPAFKPKDLNVPSAIAKMWAPETAVEIAAEAMKWLGAYSYTKECPVHRAMLGLTTYVVGAEGAQNIMRHIIARDTLGSEYVKQG